MTAVKQMNAPTNITELHHFLGMVNQLTKFTPQLSEVTKPLQELVSSKHQLLWSDGQTQAFETVRNMVSSDSILALFDPHRSTRVSADASLYGLRAVLTQQRPSDEWKPISYISRALTTTEQCYAQIEKEALAVTWACERLRDFLTGLQFHIHTDHKPLVPLLTTKGLDKLPRIQRFRLRLMSFSYTVSHIPGKDLTVADTLSRAPIELSNINDNEFQEEIEAYVNLVLEQLEIFSGSQLDVIKEQQLRDETCQVLTKYCQSEWPDHSCIKSCAKRYYSVASELSVCNDILLRGDRIIIPQELQQLMSVELYCGHQGITKCRQIARQSIWWPGVNKEMISKCLICCEHKRQNAEPLKPTPFPEYLWQRMATDLFEWKKTSYILVIDYYSRYIKIASLRNTKSSGVIQKLKTIFVQHGIPE